MLTEVEARAMTNQIKGSLDVAHQVMIEAFRGEAWKPLGYESWAQYFDAEFDGYLEKLRLCREERKRVVPQMREAGMSTRAIARAVGASKSQVDRDLTAPVPNGTPQPRITGRDGKSYPASRPALTVINGGVSVVPSHRRPGTAMRRYLERNSVGEICEAYELWQLHPDEIKNLPPDLLDKFRRDLEESRTAISQLLKLINREAA